MFFNLEHIKNITRNPLIISFCAKWWGMFTIFALSSLLFQSQSNLVADDRQSSK